MKRRIVRSMTVKLCSFAVLQFVATSAWSQTAEPDGVQGAAIQDLRRSQSMQLPSPGVAVVPEDLSRVPLAPGYLLAMQVYNAPDVSGLYRVDSSGDLTLPLVGNVHVAGLATSEAQLRVAEALKAGEFILNPNVTLTVQEYVPTYVTISGEVQTPGEFPLLMPHSVQRVLALAGGPTLFASGSVEIRRKTNGAEEKIEVPIQHDPGTDTEHNDIQPGDQVTVKRAGVVYVLGGVFRPGGYVMQESGHLDLVQAIALAAGTTMQAATQMIRVVRRNPDGTVSEIPVDYPRMVAGKESSMVLRPQDVVYVPISKLKAALMGGATSILGATSSAAIYVAR